MPDNTQKLKETVSNFVLELRRGTVMLVVLAKLRQPAYGYSLVADLAETALPIEANTLYPLLRRLEAQGLLSSSWDTDGSKPRKYYQTTTLGNEVLAACGKQWQDAAKTIDALLASCADAQEE